MKPNLKTSASELAETAARLRENRQAMPWHERRELAQLLAPALSEINSHAQLADMLDVLAADPKPEVRHAVANHLPLLPDTDFERLAAVMAT